MKKATLTFLLFITAILSGCFVVSLQPYYLESDIIEDSRLNGKWQEAGKNVIWQFHSDEDSKAYAFSLIEGKDLTGHFIGTPFKIENAFFIDVYPNTKNDDALRMSDAYKLHRIPAHSLIHVQQIEESALVLRVPSYPWLTKYLEANPTVLKHEIVEGSFPVLTATTKELQDFWFKHLETEDAYIETELTKLPE